MTCTEAYKEHIEYTFNAFCRVVIRYVAINAWHHIHSALQMLHEEMEVLFNEES